MDDQMLDFKDPADRITGRLLQAYGEDHLSPSIAATTKMRMAVMSAAHRRAALIEADATIGAAGETTTALATKRAQAARNAWRRPVAAVLAGTLTLGILAGTAFAARPGGPLYGARLWTEMANLPAGLVDRAEAESHRLERRMEEAQQASTAGDDAGTTAALVAYSTIVVEAARGTDQNQAAKTTIEVTVTQHVLILTQMVQSVPAPARAAAQEALSSTTMALDDLTGASGSGTDDQRVGADQPAPADPATRRFESQKPGKHDGAAKPDKLTPDGTQPADRPVDKPVQPDEAP